MSKFKYWTITENNGTSITQLEARGGCKIYEATLVGRWSITYVYDDGIQEEGSTTYGFSIIAPPS